MDSSVSLQGQPHNATTNDQQSQNITINCSANCEICKKSAHDSTGIFCDSCKLVFHTSCANIDDDQSKKSWLCLNCTTRPQAPPKSPCSIRSSSSKSSHGSRSRKQNLYLQRLEEETQLKREFIRKKYKILEQTIGDDSDSVSDISSVHDWEENEPNTFQQLNNAICNNETSAEASKSLNKTLPVPTSLPATSVSTTKIYTNQPVQSHLINNSTKESLEPNAQTFINSAPQNNTRFNLQYVSTLPNRYEYSSIHTNNHAQHLPNFQPTSTQFHPQQSFNTHQSFYQPHCNTANQQTFSAPHPNLSINDQQAFSSLPADFLSHRNLTHQQLNARQTVPKDLPIFTGQPEQWPLFNSTYNWSTTICGITEAENLVRLQKALRGEALRSVQHLLIHPSCVPAVMSTLKLLYGQPEKILNSLKNKIRLLPALNTNKLHTITAFAIEVKGLETTIQACGLFDELNNTSLLQELVAKMPSYFQLNWGTFRTELTKQNKKVNLTEFANWIYDVGISASCVNVENNSSRSMLTDFSTNKTKNAYINTHDEEIKRNCFICNEHCNSVGKCKKFLAANRNERWNYVRKFNLCKNCLRRHYGSCKSNIVCGIENCKSKHNTLLHRTTEEQKEINVSKESIQNKELIANTHAAHNSSDSDKILFKVIPVVIYGENDKNVETYAFIDEGSSISLINENIINDLNLNGEPEPLCLKWTGGIERNEPRSKRVYLNISGPNKIKYNLAVRTVNQLSLPSQSLNYDFLCNKFPHLKGLQIANYSDAVPTILLGIDNIKYCLPTRIKEGKSNEPIAIRTRLGWFVCGNSIAKQEKHFEYNFHICDCSHTNDNKLNDLMKKFYSIEMQGISCKETVLGKNEERALNILKTNTKQTDNGHFETGLLWRYDDVELPRSYEMAMKRLRCLERTLKTNTQLKEVFEKTIEDYKQKGFIAKINPNENDKEVSKKVWYLPIFPVVNKNKPNKIRIVWDAAAKAKGVSLNCMLLKGPDMLASLTSILFQFREKKVAICGDIEQMFHQVFIRQEDRNAQRFLWRNCDETKEPDIYVMNVLIFGASCAPCISQYIKNLNASNYEKQYPAAVAFIKNNHYVDDFLASTDSAEEASKLAKEVRYIHSQAGFNIRNWSSNSIAVLQDLNSNISQNNMCLNFSEGLETEKVLGIFWVPKNDLITFKLSPSAMNNKIYLGNMEPTKREVLKFLMSIYDPLGLIGNFLMYLKITLQEIWRSGVKWDEPILQPQVEKWKHWLSFLPNLKNISIPRCYLQHLKNYANLDVQLHTFVDASENGYAAVSYIRCSNGNQTIVSLIGSKSRVSPLKVISIPRLELMAALIGARFAKTIIETHSIKFNRKVFWSDSQTVLSWIRSDHRKYHQFVAVRIGEIVDISEVSEWFWIAGKNNVADEATKWTQTPNFKSSSRWFNGPEFLKLPEKEWQLKTLNFPQTEVEMKQTHLVIEDIKTFINTERFSRWSRLLRTTAYVIRFCNIVKKQHISRNNKELTQEELVKAELILLKQAQQQEFFNEIKSLSANKSVQKNSPLYKLSPFIDCNKLIHVGGRIENANIVEEFKHPVILPKYCHITKLIILHIHNLYHHINYETLVNEIRQRYYIPKLRVVCKYFLKQCQMCKIKNALPVYPQMAKLPRCRLACNQLPFTYTGLDFFGPLYVTVNRHKEKRYGALFTCLTIRAVHIEIVHSLNTSSCIMAIRNFTSRRGQPREYFSDNGTNFVGADRELREAIKEVDKNELVRTFTTSTTKWSFNPPSAPHMGGAWERLVRSVKTVLYKIKQERYPDDETLRGMMAEVENIINSRPLTYVPIESENREAITPNHFLLGSSNGIKPLALYNDDGVVLKQCWLRCQQYAEVFWKRWVTEYLPTLTCRTKWFEKTKPLAVGDLVIVVDPINPRNVWPRGKIIEVFKSTDGQVRKAKVLTTCGILERPAAKLAVLDVIQQ